MTDQGITSPFPIDEVMDRIREAVRAYPKAAMFELAEEGYDTPFEQLISCMISIRTMEEVTLPTSRRLFAAARTPEAIAALSVSEIDELIGTSTFHERKAEQIHAIANRVVNEYGGELPCDEAVMTSFPGIGPKCAHLALGIACNQPLISVDIHVHRVTNRWGFIRTKTPEKSMVALEQVLPQRYWIEINKLLVPFGKYICTGERPKCSTCPVREYCQQVGVTSRR